MMSLKKWQLFHYDKKLIENLSHELSLSYIISHLLINRNIKNLSDANKFLNPRLNEISSPFKMKDTEKAIKIIKNKINECANIYIYGDYDVDGITAISVLYKVLTSYYKKINFYIPHRLEEGYGLNKEALYKIKQEGGNLVITVDCGIQSLEEVEYAKSIGLDIIITDHHLPGKKIPDADAVINPHQNGCEYPFKELAGVGVAYQLARGIMETFSNSKNLSPINNVEDRINDSNLLDLVALGTVADIVPLLDENRIFVKYGIEVLNNTKNIGLKHLIKISGIEGKKIDTEHISFFLAPRLNAGGRMKNAYLSLELLITEDESKARQIASELSAINDSRQKLLNKTVEEAVYLVDKHIDLKNEPLIVLAWQDWHVGIIGLVASKLVEKYSRPAIVIALDGEKGKGSGRSVKNVNLFKTVCECGDLLTKVGGHSQAIGLNIEKRNIKKFRQEINNILRNSITWENLHPFVEIDSILVPEEIDFKLINDLKQLAPFGTGNPKPVFAFRKIPLKSSPKILKDKHLKFNVGNNENVFSAIFFNQAERIDLLQNKTIDMVFNLILNNWNGEETIDLHVKEIGNDKI